MIPMNFMNNTTRSPKVTEKYQVVTTNDILSEICDNTDLRVRSIQRAKCRSLDNTPFVKHLVRLAPNAPEQTDGPEIIIVNSHNGTSGVQLYLGYFRVACANGLIVGDLQYGYHFKHIGEGLMDKILTAIGVMTKGYAQIQETIRAWRGVILSDSDIWRMAEHVARDILPKYSSVVLPDFRILTEVWRVEDYSNDLWSVFNVIQEHVLKGGQRYVTAQGRRMCRRGIKAIEANVSLNRDLWNVASAMFEYKQGES